METWANWQASLSVPSDLLWRHALAAIPLILLIAGVTRWVPCRPATRHTLWLSALLWLLVAPFLPQAPSLSIVTRTRPVTLADTEPSDPAGRLARSVPHGANEVLTWERSLTVGVGRVPDAPLSSLKKKDAPPARLKASPAEPAIARSVAVSGGASGAGVPSRIPLPDWREWTVGLLAVRDAVAAVPSIPATIWLGGAGFLLLCGLLRIVRSRRLLRDARRAPAAVRQLVREAADEMGLRRIPEVYMIRRRISPLIWCGRQVRLILPATLWSRLDPASRRAVIFHELAHVRRRDHWVSWVELVVGAIYWWYPLVWWVRSRVHAEAEHCCDAWVTTLFPGGRRAYAEALLKTKQYVRIDDRLMPIVGIGMTTGRAAARSLGFGKPHGVGKPLCGRFARRLSMVMTQSVKPRLSVSGVVLVLAVVSAGWLVTPAHSCPPAEKSAAAIAPTTPARLAADVPFAIAAGAPCADCKSSKPCTSCEGCQTRWPGFSFVPNALNTFQQHLAKRAAKGGRQVVVPPSDWVGVAPTLFAPELKRVRFVGDKTDMERRLEKLERRLERMGDRLAEVSQSVRKRGRVAEDGAKKSRAKAKGKSKTRAKERRQRRERVERRERASREPRVAHEPREPRPPRPPRPARELRAPHAVTDIRRGPDDDSREVIRTYELPGGKLEALTELMLRADVPVLVRSLDDGIEVHATKAQHRTFWAFVRMIHPSGRRVVRPSKGASVYPAPGYRKYMDESAYPSPDYVADARVAYEIASHQADAYIVRAEDAYRQALGQRRATLRAAEGLAAEKAVLQSELQARLKQLGVQAGEAETQVEAIHKQAENIEKRAKKSQERAQELERKAQELEKRMEDREE